MFGPILKKLAASVPGSIGVLFLDYEGETVAMLGERPFDLADDALRIIGAYQAIFLTQLRELCERIDAGPLRRMKFDFADARVFCCDLKDGYYLVFVTDLTTSEGLAWRHLGLCAELLLAEI